MVCILLKTDKISTGLCLAENRKKGFGGSVVCILLKTDKISTGLCLAENRKKGFGGSVVCILLTKRTKRSVSCWRSKKKKASVGLWSMSWWKNRQKFERFVSCRKIGKTLFNRSWLAEKRKLRWLSVYCWKCRKRLRQIYVSCWKTEKFQMVSVSCWTKKETTPWRNNKTGDASNPNNCKPNES